MKTFLKTGEVKLVNGGYLSDSDNKPVSHIGFVKAQRHAEYVIAFAKAAKGKNFTAQKVDSIEAIKAEVLAAISKTEVVEFVKKPKSIKRPTTDKLASEALAFIDFGKETTKADKINKFLIAFSEMHEFEEHGLFFDQDIVKLNELYTMEQVVSAVSEVIDLLG